MSIHRLQWTVFKCVDKYQRLSIGNSLLRAESDMTVRVLSYALSADIVNMAAQEETC